MGMAEIQGSPLSRHDIDVVHYQWTFGLARALKPLEVHVSSLRLKEDGLVLFGGLAVRRADWLELNEGQVTYEGREPIKFRFEDTDD